jgi:hypothetical protein
MATGRESLSRRFADVWSERVMTIESSEVSDYLRPSFEELRDRVTAIAGVSYAPDALLELTEGRARQLTSTLFLLAELATELSIVTHYGRRLQGAH